MDKKIQHDCLECFTNKLWKLKNFKDTLQKWSILVFSCIHFHIWCLLGGTEGCGLIL